MGIAPGRFKPCPGGGLVTKARVKQSVGREPVAAHFAGPTAVRIKTNGDAWTIEF